MPIGKIVAWDIFDTSRLNPGESDTGIHVICATNTLGRNRDGNSVAHYIGTHFQGDFLQFPEWPRELGHVYTRRGDLGAVPARFSAIVANVVSWDHHPTQTTDHDWQFAPHGISQWLQVLSDDVTVRPPNSEHDALEQRTLSQIQSIQDLRRIREILAEHDAKINPVVRSVFMGTGRSWQLNHANTLAILEAMSASDVNIYLYLRELDVRAHVAQVIQLHPNLRAHAPLNDYAQLLAA